MVGYPIINLKKAESISAQDAIPLQQNGVTRMIEAGVMDQAVIIKSSGSQSSGIIRKEDTFVLKSETLINFTLENAAGRIVQDNEYVDNAEAASGWIIHVVNASGIQHTVIHGANSWPIPAGETLVFYWTGSRFTLHNIVLNNLTVRGNAKLMNVSAVSALAASNKIPVIGTDDIVKYTTPAAITDGLASKAELNNALADYYAQKKLSRVREKRVGEIYNSNGYWKVTMKGYYARPIVFKCIGTVGLYDIVMFGQFCTSKLIRLGNESSQVTYKYTRPTSNNSDGFLYIKSNLANTSHTIFSIDVFGGDLIGTLESCTQEEYNNATAF